MLRTIFAVPDSMPIPLLRFDLGSIRVLAPGGRGSVFSISRLGRDRIQTHGVNISISRLGRGRVLTPGVNISITRLGRGRVLTQGVTISISRLGRGRVRAPW